MEVADEQLDTISDPLTHFLMGEGRTHAELMRMHAIDATNEGGVWFSGEYATMLADAAESLEEENKRLRELASLNWEWRHSCCGSTCKMRTDECGYGVDRDCNYEREIYDRMRELGVD